MYCGIGIGIVLVSVLVFYCGIGIGDHHPAQGLKNQAPEHASHLLAARLDHLEARLGREVHIQLLHKIHVRSISFTTRERSKTEL